MWLSASPITMMMSMVIFSVILLAALILYSGVFIPWSVMFLSFIGGLVALLGFMVGTHIDWLSKSSSPESSSTSLMLPRWWRRSWLVVVVVVVLTGMLGSDLFPWFSSQESFLVSELEEMMSLLTNSPLVMMVEMLIFILFLGLYFAHEVSRVYLISDMSM
uniref:NADH dehydrogenase subunit 6 n=1 Tax=Bovicola ovis TaxID=186214 RepID=A0A386B2F7_9NEOP|nr:NADH dehydrogenase subunit 6 [Bovicola ovis]